MITAAKILYVLPAVYIVKYRFCLLFGCIIFSHNGCFFLHFYFNLFIFIFVSHWSRSLKRADEM